MFTESIPAVADQKMKDADGLTVESKARRAWERGKMISQRALKTNRNHQSRV
jgi:hypothetical protein